MRTLLCLAVLLVTAASVTAGPIRDRIAARFENRPGLIVPKFHRGASNCGGSCSSCPSCDSCPGGNCPLPAASAPAKVVRYTTVCENGRCVLVPVRE